MLWVCVACVIILICGVVFFYAKISAILDNIDEMIDRALDIVQNMEHYWQ